MDLKNVVKRISVTCLMFIVGSYCLTFSEGFNMVVVKGSVMAAVIYPPIYMHYNVET